jgi:hypothetical protein
VKVIDLNLLMYAVNADAPQHTRARRWWETTLGGDEQVGLAWNVVLGFLRLSTRAGVLPKPLPPRQAFTIIEEWVTHPLVVALDPGARHCPLLRGLLEAVGTAANLTTDAHLAALAIEYDATLCTSDDDFSRFPGLKRFNPLASA